MKRKISILLLTFCIFILGACGETKSGETEHSQVLDGNNDIQQEIEESIEEEKQSECEWIEDIDYLEKSHPQYFQDITKIDESWKDAKDYGVYVNNYSWNEYSTTKIIIESTGGPYSTAEENYIDHIQIFFEHLSLEDEQYTIDSALNWIRDYTDMSILENQYSFKEARHIINEGLNSEYYEMLYLSNDDGTAEKYGRVFCAQITTDSNGRVGNICLEHSELNNISQAQESVNCYDWDGHL